MDPHQLVTCACGTLVAPFHTFRLAPEAPLTCEACYRAATAFHVEPPSNQLELEAVQDGDPVDLLQLDRGQLVCVLLRLRRLQLAVDAIRADARRETPTHFAVSASLIEALDALV